MSIAKLLMTAVICTMSMSVSMSFGAFSAELDLDAKTPNLVFAERPQRDDDSRSVMSTMSVFDKDSIERFLKKIMKACIESGVNPPKIASKATKLQRVEAYVKEVVSSHNGLKTSVSDSIRGFQIILEAIGLTENEKTQIDSGDVNRDALIVSRIAKINEKAVDAETRAIKAESSRIAWKIGAVISSCLLVAVVGVLINIFNAHGFEIIFLQKAE